MILNYFYRQGVKKFWNTMNQYSRKGPDRLKFLDEAENFPQNYKFNGNPSSAAITKSKLLVKLDRYDDFKFEILDLFGMGRKVCIRWKLNVLEDGTWHEKTATNVITFSLLGRPQTNWQTGPHKYANISKKCFWEN